MDTPCLLPPRSLRIAMFAASLLATVALAAAPAHASGTKAGTLINNTATATFSDAGGTSTTIKSNTVSLRVDEVLNVTVAARESGDASVGPGATAQVRSFTVTNAGNGPEAFNLVAAGQVSGNTFDPTVTSLVLDSNGNGVYDAGVDQVLGAGAVTPVLDPDAAATIFVLSTLPAAATDGQRGAVKLDAAAVTGTGAPGTVFAGKGFGGGDAIVGATRADAFSTGAFVISHAAVGFVKSATIADPFGGARIVPGSVVTYRLVASVTGSGIAKALKVDDAAPDGTTYQPGTLTLDGNALTDAADSDAGTVTATGLEVALGDAAAGTTHAVEFKVKIK